MSKILSIYSKNSFEEFLLPSENNIDYSLVLNSEHFNLKKDVILNLEVLNDIWVLKKSKDYAIKVESKVVSQVNLEEKTIIKIKTKNSENISIIVKEKDNIFNTYKKYSLNNISEITIGKDADNDIVFDYSNFISRSHAKIYKSRNGYIIKNLSSNGIYVNSIRIDSEVKLEFGAYINILGLHIVFLDNLLAVDTSNKNVAVNNSKFKEYHFPQSYLEKNASVIEYSKGKKIYHRAPRNFEKINTDEAIEIEAAPQLNKTKRQPLYMTIGPSVTMALPMLLGCMLMIYASNKEGGSTSLYMYSGLIMAVSSAIVGVFWALMNIKYTKKEEKEQEEHRLVAYKEYLLEKTDEIKEKYLETEKKLKDTYISAEKCFSAIKNGSLWNRNITHSDFLCHRLGIGEQPFPVELQVPKKKFALYKDELDDKPAFIRDNYKTLYNVPILLDFTTHKLIGIVGGNKKQGAFQVAKALSVQIAANNCYTDVKMCFVFDKTTFNEKNEWGFAKWLPHTWSKDKKTRFVANTKEEASDVFYELTKVFRKRAEDSQNNDESIKKVIPYYIVFVSNISMLEGELFSKYAFDDNDKYGLSVVLLAEQYEELPNNCNFIIENTDSFKGMYEVYDDFSKRQIINFDSVDNKDIENFSRSISSFQVLEIEEGGEIPNAITFFEMLKINSLDDLCVKETWAKSRIYENIRGMLGQKAGGAPCYLDVHEKYHGPHGLVAGTTGSGKSETLQTYLLSLAINYSPDDIGFFIIDYKGGGMANLFEGLPHMIGQISNLSGNQVKRAMISIKSENRRRQRLFSENGVNNINAYTKLYKNGETTIPIPHLFIIIDEFAELKREEPDFMRELVSVAQVGRSLGVHLILATQKPSGTVDDNIWSNSKFRLCLRVQDQQDSKDMLHNPDAAYITQAGRGYLQVGNNEVYELFQSGYSGATYSEDMIGKKLDVAKIIDITGKTEITGNSIRQSQKKKTEFLWLEKLITALEDAILVNNITNLDELIFEEKSQLVIKSIYEWFSKKQIDYQESKYNSARLLDFIEVYSKLYDSTSEDKNSLIKKIIEISLSENIKLPQEKELTQLGAVKDYLSKVAKENGYNNKQQLWMPVLPESIYLSEFDDYCLSCFSKNKWNTQNNEWSLNIIIGKMDDPENQNQMPFSIDFSTNGNIAVLGNIVCGKSTLMQTMAFALIQKYSPEVINIYAIDFSSKMMSCFEHSPHFGGVMFENDLEKINKFFNMIESILKERKELFRGGNYKQYVRVNGVEIPSIIIFIDNYANFKEKTGEAYEETLIRISKEGINHGIFLVVSGSGFGINDITTRVGENLNTTLCLTLSDKYVYSDYLHTMQIDVLPESGIKGRGLAYYGSRILEYQTALSIEAENDYDRIDKIEKICKEMNDYWDGKSARRIPEIPKKPTWSDFIKNEGYELIKDSNEFIPVGYNAENAEIFSISLRDTYCYMVCGKQRTGKTNFIKVCIQSLMEKNANICIIDTEEKTIGSFNNGKVTNIREDKEIFEYFKELLPVFKKRNTIKNNLINEEKDEDEIFDVISKEIPYFIFISDLCSFIQKVYNSEYGIKGFLENIVEKGSLHNIYFIAEYDLDTRSDMLGYRLYELFSSYKTGIHFGGKVVDNQVLPFDNVPFIEQSKSEKVGIGIIPASDRNITTTKVVIPLARR